MESHRYCIRVCPQGATPDDSTEVREFEFTTATEDPDILRDQAADHIISNRLMDPQSFRAYWDIHSVTRATTADDVTPASPTTAGTTQTTLPTVGAVTDLKRRLPNKRCGERAAAKLEKSTGQKAKLMTLYVDDPATGWVDCTLCLPDHLTRDFKLWVTMLERDNQVVAAAPRRELHEAIIRAVAGLDPTFATTFGASSPQDHTHLIQQAMSMPGIVVNELKAL